MAADGSIIIDTRINSNGMRRGVNEVESAMRRLGGVVKKIGILIAGAFAVKGLVDFGKECLRLGSDLEEVQNVVDVTFPHMTDRVNEFARSAADAFGLSETMAKKYVGTFGAMAKSFGYSEEAAHDMATALAGLTGDVASFYNISQDLAYIKLKSVFSGETETLKDLGIVMTQNALDQYALANGYGKTTAKMTEQEKVALRLRFVQEQLSAASGDFARTSDSWANQVRIMQLRLQSLKATIGQGLINLFTPVIKAINTFLAKLEVATEAFKRFTETVTGRKSGSSSTSVPPVVSGDIQETEAIAGVQDGYEGAADSAEKYGDAVEEAGKKTKKALAPFDELATLEEETTEETVAPVIDIPKAEEIPPELSQDAAGESPFLSGVLETLGKIKDRLVELGGIFQTGFWEGMGNYKPVLEEMKKDLQSIGGYLMDIFTDADVMAAAKQFVDSYVLYIGRLAGSFFSMGLTIAANLIGGLEVYLSGNVDRIKAWLIRMFDIQTEIFDIVGRFFVTFADVFSVFSSQTAQDITGSIIQIFSDVFGGVLELTFKFTRDVLDMILTPFTENKDKIKNALAQTLEPVKVVAQSIADTVRKAVDKIVALYDEHIHPFFESIRDGLTEILGKLVDGYTEYIAPVLDRLAAKFKEVMEGPVGDAVNSAITFLGKLMDAVKLLWENELKPFVKWIAEYIFPVIAPVLEGIGKLALDLLAAVSNVIGGIFDILSGLIDFIVGVFTGDWKKAWEGVKEIFSGIWKLIFGNVQTVIEDISNLISGVMKSISKLLEAVGKAPVGPALRSGKSGYTSGRTAYPTSAYSTVAYRMPRLATGTVVPPRAGEFAAILGDNKREPEVVSPLSTMRQAFREEIASVGLGQERSGSPIYMQIDGKTFARLMAPYLDSEKSRVGVNLVIGGTGR
ncbi:MAG: hypothetical protein HFI15_10935 [Lachnospiraceae bacterium]|nr:hypothetical protein [Lachnospiraceae bacterium]